MSAGMDELRQFVINHTERGTCRCGKCFDHPGEDTQPSGHTFDLVFFEVCVKDDPDPELFRDLIKANPKGEFGDLDPFDGKEHSYLEVGGWIGDQGMALMLLGLGHLLGLWKVSTPKMLPGISGELIQKMARRGYVFISATSNGGVV